MGIRLRSCCFWPRWLHSPTSFSSERVGKEGGSTSDEAGGADKTDSSDGTTGISCEFQSGGELDISFASSSSSQVVKEGGSTSCAKTPSGRDPALTIASVGMPGQEV